MIGELAILNVAAGDTKLSFDPQDQNEVKRASAIVEDMLKRGFALLIQIGEDDDGPIYRRAKGFDPKTAEYIVVGNADPVEQSADEEEPESPPRRGRKVGKAATHRVPAASTKAVAVARTAGG